MSQLPGTEPAEPRPTQADWAAQAADTIERVVLTVRDRTTQPILVLARALVFGLLGIIVAIAALVLLSIALVRILAFIPPDIWVADLIVGGTFTIIGLVLMAKRHAEAESEGLAT